MVLGSSCSDRGSSLGLLFGDGGCRGTRLYFVLLGRVSASISWRKDCSSFSASSSLVKGFEGVLWSGAAGGAAADCGEDVVFSWAEEGAASEGLDQSQPIANVSGCERGGL